MEEAVDFEFFKIVLPGKNKKHLRLPPKFTGLLRDRWELKVWLTNRGAMQLWDVTLVSSDNVVYLGHDWSQFARTYDLIDGDLVIFHYDGAAVLTVKVFDPSTCCNEYPHATGDGSSGTNAPHINEPSHFVVTLKMGNLKEKQSQYLNVPVSFHEAHGYARRWKVVLHMGGRSWTVSLKLSRRPFGSRVAFKYGWHQFCVDNGLEVGDTCFFRVARELKDCEEEDDAMEVEEDDDDDEHVLKVEVHKKDGTFVA